MENDIFYLTQGDRLPKLRRQLFGPDGVPLNLTGATVVINMKGRDGMKITNGACTVVAPATEGWVEYAWAVADTNTAGEYEVKFRATLSGLPLSCPNYGHLQIKIDKDVA